MPRLIPCILLLCSTAAAQLPPPPTPPENPITGPKRVLGKMLFWEAQLSSDNTMACGTCHIMSSGGGDPRLGFNPGLDVLPGTPDDKTGSPGMIRADINGVYAPDPVFGLMPQVTRRSAQPVIMSQYAPSLFWDGRAEGPFIDPQGGGVLIPGGGALEIQAVAPVTSDVEMAHETRDWDEVTVKLQGAIPMALATNLPADIAAALDGETGYPDLFANAFGDPAITAGRIGMAIATYERTLIPDQTPFDLGTMTPGQQQGFDTFMSPQSQCFVCHGPPMFTNFDFRNIGLRPIPEDTGRQEATGSPVDAGRFKVPSLRNVGLKSTFMHNGRIGTLNGVLDFYRNVPGVQQFPQNQDPIMPLIDIPQFLVPNLLDFLRNALIDPRVVNEEFPFDRPTLHTELLANPTPLFGATVGSGGLPPQMIAVVPPNLGNADFKIGLARALGGSTASLLLSRVPPSPRGELETPYAVEGPFALPGAGPGDGHATWHWSIPDDDLLLGDTLHAQWIVDDPQALDGVARSGVARISLYRRDPTQCGCGTPDHDCDELIGVDDLVAVILSWGPCDLCNTDTDDDGDVDVDDLIGVILQWGSCG